MLAPARPILMMILLMAAGCLRAQPAPSFVEHASVQRVTRRFAVRAVDRAAGRGDQEDFEPTDSVSLINTHVHADHTGGNENFAKLGVLIFSRDQQRDMVLAVRDRVSALVSQGKSLQEVIAAKPTAAFDAQVSQSAETAERFIWWIYTEVKAAPNAIARDRRGQ
jgi:glyoxylase-like metal-dependent hydrolase (beta-lactamase superfamily II)